MKKLYLFIIIIAVQTLSCSKIDNDTVTFLYSVNCHNEAKITYLNNEVLRTIIQHNGIWSTSFTLSKSYYYKHVVYVKVISKGIININIYNNGRNRHFSNNDSLEIKY